MTSPYADQVEWPDDGSRLVDHSREIGRLDQYLGKRRWTRWSTGMALEATSDPSDHATPWAAIMKNVSGGGIALWVRKKFDLGRRVYIREFNPEAPTDWIQGEVIYCRVGIRGSLVGVKFDDPDPSDGLYSPFSCALISRVLLHLNGRGSDDGRPPRPAAEQVADDECTELATRTGPDHTDAP